MTITISRWNDPLHVVQATVTSCGCSMCLSHFTTVNLTRSVFLQNSTRTSVYSTKSVKSAHTHARHQKSLKKDPFTCFTRRRIDVRKQSKPSILTIPSGTHLPVTIYQRYWTHIVVLPPLEHFSNVPLTGLGTVSLSVLARRGSRVGNQWKCV